MEFTDAISTLEEVFLARDVLALVLATYLFLRFVDRLPWRVLGLALARIHPSAPDIGVAAWRRVMVVAPEIIGGSAVALDLIPSLRDHGPVIKIAVSLWVGYATQRAHKVLGQTILGDDPQIRERAATRVARREAAEGERNDEG